MGKDLTCVCVKCRRLIVKLISTAPLVEMRMQAKGVDNKPMEGVLVGLSR